MELKEKIYEDFNEAYRNKEMDKKNFLAVLKGYIQTQEGKNIISTDENVMKAVKSLEKGLIETIEKKKQLGKDTKSEEFELSCLKPYLPELMSDEEVEIIVRGYYNDKGLTTMSDMMRIFNTNHKGKADNKIVASIINKIISGR